MTRFGQQTLDLSNLSKREQVWMAAYLTAVEMEPSYFAASGKFTETFAYEDADRCLEAFDKQFTKQPESPAGEWDEEKDNSEFPSY